MAIVRDSTGGGSWGSGTSYTFGHTCSGSNRLLLVFAMGLNNNGDIITGVTYAGVGMTLLAKYQIPFTSAFISLYGLLNPASGSNNVIISGSNSGPAGASVSYNGVSQSGLPNAVNTYLPGSVSTTSMSLTTTIDKCALVAITENNGGGESSSDLTPTANVSSIASVFFGAGRLNVWESNSLALTPAGVKTVNVSHSTGTSGAIMIAIAPILPPTATTQAASSVSANSAVGNGNITNTGGASCDIRGIEWGTTSGVYTFNNDESGSFGTGAYTRNITGLSPNVTYYARARVHNSEGWSYGAEISFTTPKVAPTVTTTSIDLVSYINARSAGNVSADGGDTVTERGICWGTGHNPTTVGSKTIASGTLGSFTAAITGLTKNITYYARAYAVNSIGTSYGAEISFKTPDLNFFTLGSPTTNVINRMRWGLFTWS